MFYHEKIDGEILQWAKQNNIGKYDDGIAISYGDAGNVFYDGSGMSAAHRRVYDPSQKRYYILPKWQYDRQVSWEERTQEWHINSILLMDLVKLQKRIIHL